MIDKPKYKRIDWSKVKHTSKPDPSENRSIMITDLITGDYEVIIDGIVSSYRKDGTLVGRIDLRDEAVPITTFDLKTFESRVLIDGLIYVYDKNGNLTRSYLYNPAEGRGFFA